MAAESDLRTTEKRNLKCLVGVRLLPAEYERALAQASSEGITLPALMRRLLVNYLTRGPLW